MDNLAQVQEENIVEVLFDEELNFEVSLASCCCCSSDII
jgi:hypothetical protein